MEFFQAIANMSGDSLAQHLANGISLGSLYALIAIGYTMVYGILLMINFAHGDIVMMACYFAFFGITVFHIPWYITFVGVIIATAILGVVIERTAYRPLRDAPKNSVLISAIGFGFITITFDQSRAYSLSSCCLCYVSQCQTPQNSIGITA